MTSIGSAPHQQSHSMTMVLGVTCLLTIPVLAWIASSFWWRHWGFNTVLYGLFSFGSLALIAYPVIYVGGLYLYARELRFLVAQVPEANRLIHPTLVWLIVAVPLNFVGSIYVIARIGQSLRGDGRISALAAQRWSAIGLSWAALQIMAFFPNAVVSLVVVLLAYFAWGLTGWNRRD